MAMCLPFTLCVKKENSNKKKINSLVMFIPSLCDVLATIFDANGLYYVSIINILLF
jgi:hypothetical protein